MARSKPRPSRCRRAKSRLTQEGLGQAASCTGGDCAGEQALRAARQSALQSKTAGLQASADQARRDAGEAAATINSLQGSLALAQKQVDMLEPLAAKHIVPQTDLMDKRREVIDLQGRIAAAREQQGKAMAAVREAQAQASQANFEFRQQALDERSQVKAKLAVNEQSLLGAKGKQDRTEVRSPVDGVVNDVQVTTIGSFVQPGQKIMEVVPLGEKLLVETRVKPSDIAFIKVGDRAMVRVTAYDFSIYGGLDGRVVQVSADFDLRRQGKAGLFHGHRRNRPKLSQRFGAPPADHSGHDDQHADHHRLEEHPDLPVEAGVEGEERGAARALIARRRHQRRRRIEIG